MQISVRYWLFLSVTSFMMIAVGPFNSAYAVEELGVDIRDVRTNWHELYMLIEPRGLDANVTILNRSTENVTAELGIVLTYLSPTVAYNNLEHRDSNIKLGPGGSFTYTYHSRQLWIGPWKMQVNVSKVNVTTVNGETITQYTWPVSKDYSFLVFSETDYYNRLAIIATVASPILALGIAAFTLRAMKKQNSIIASDLETARDELQAERVAKWREAYKPHSESIGHAIFKGWNKSERILAKCSYAEANFTYKPSVEKNREVLPDVERAKLHFVHGYPREWNRFLAAKSESEDLCNEMIDDLDTFELGIANLLSTETELSHVGRWEDGTGSFYVEQDIYRAIMNETCCRLKGQRMAFTIDRTNSPTSLQRGAVALARGSIAQMESLEKLLNEIIDNAAVRELLQRVGQNERKFGHSALADELHQNVLSIANDTRSGIPLAAPGCCEVCRLLYMDILKKAPPKYVTEDVNRSESKT